MGSKSKNSVSDQLKDAKVAVTNSIEDLEIQSMVAKFGYDVPALNLGMGIYDDADAAVAAAAAANGAQKQSTDDVDKAKEEAITAYQDLSTIAKSLFKKEPGVLSKLGLDRPMPRTTAGLTTAGYILFDNAALNPDVMAKLADRGYNEAKLASERSKIAAFDAADNKQEAAKGANRQASSVEAAALKKLDDWLAEYRKVAKIALREKKSLLNKLGIKVRTRKTPAQRQAPAKAAATRAAKKQLDKTG